MAKNAKGIKRFLYLIMLSDTIICLQDNAISIKKKWKLQKCIKKILTLIISNTNLLSKKRIDMGKQWAKYAFM